MQTVIIRCDFGPNYGLGHLMRCIAVAQALVANGSYEIFCICKPFPSNLMPLLQQAPMKIINLGDDLNGLDFNPSEIIKDYDQAITIFDSYEVTYQQMCQYKKQSPLLVAIDDLADRRFCVDIIINHNFGAEQLRYQNDIDGTLLLGKDYALLRDDVTHYRQQLSTYDGGKNIFMSFGGGDVYSRIRPLLLALIKIEQQLTQPLTIDLVVPPVAQQMEQIKKLLSPLTRITINYHHANFALSSIMVQADFAITAAGTTVFELACLAVPQLLVKIADNQQLAVDYIESYQIGECIADCKHFDERKFIEKFIYFVCSTTTKQRYRTNAKNCIDGNGAQRVIKQISNNISKQFTRKKTC